MQIHVCILKLRFLSVLVFFTCLAVPCHQHAIVGPAPVRLGGIRAHIHSEKLVGHSLLYFVFCSTLLGSDKKIRSQRTWKHIYKHHHQPISKISNKCCYKTLLARRPVGKLHYVMLLEHVFHVIIRNYHKLPWRVWNRAPAGRCHLCCQKEEERPSTPSL